MLKMIGVSLGASLGEISVISDAFVYQSLLKKRMNTLAKTGGALKKQHSENIKFKSKKKHIKNLMMITIFMS